MRLPPFGGAVSTAVNQLFASVGESAKNGTLLRHQVNKLLTQVRAQFDTHGLKAPTAS